MILAYNTSTKKVAGFTLIELLVTMMISGILMAFVGPVAFEQIDSAKAKSEIKKLKGIIRYSSMESYTEGKGISVQFSNNKTYKDNDISTQLTFFYITFPKQNIFFNRNGYPNQVKLTYSYKNEITHLDIYSLLGYKEDEFIYVP